MLSLEQVVILSHCHGASKSAIAYAAAKLYKNSFFDEAVARKMIDHLRTAGFVRQEEGVFWLTRAGQRALARSMEDISKVSLLTRIKL